MDEEYTPTPDQYRREGFQAGIEAAKEACRNTIKNYDVMEPGKPDHYASRKTQYAAKSMVRLAIQDISAIDPAEVLAKAGKVETTAGPWALDTSTGSEILVKGGCSVIEGEDARYLLRLIAADTSTPAPDAGTRLVEAARALGAMPEGYCFCSANRVGDDSKIHEPECADLRATLVAKENEQCQVSIGPAIGATINGLHGSGAGAPDAVDNSYTDDLIDLIGEFGREVYHLLDDCETSGPVGEEIHTITEDGLRKVSAILDRIDALPFGEPGVMLGTGAMLQAAIMQTFAHPPPRAPEGDGT